MTYDEYKATTKNLTAKVDVLSSALKSDFPTALTDETIRLSNEYSIRSGEFNKAYQALQNFNRNISKDFKRQHAQEKRLNANEKAVLNYIIENGDEWCDGPTLHPADIFIDMSKHQIAGYISDLWKKGQLMHSEMPNGCISWSAKTWITV